jgi:hypothetical protein
MTTGPAGFDVLAVDAFSSDAIPVHLLTREALALYLRHLRDPDGILALHISNRHLDLRPVVSRLAEHFGLEARLVRAARISDYTSSSVWILLYRPRVGMNPDIAAAGKPLPPPSPGFRLWTDDYSNLLGILH